MSKKSVVRYSDYSLSLFLSLSFFLSLSLSLSRSLSLSPPLTHTQAHTGTQILLLPPRRQYYFLALAWVTAEVKSRTASVMRHLASFPMQVVPSLHPAEILLLLAYGVANPGKFPAQDKVLVAVVVVWRKVVARFMNRYT